MYVASTCAHQELGGGQEGSLQHRAEIWTETASSLAVTVKASMHQYMQCRQSSPKQDMSDANGSGQCSVIGGRNKGGRNKDMTAVLLDVSGQ